MPMCSAEEAPTVMCKACKRCAMCRIPSIPSTDLKAFHTPIELYSVATEDIAEIRKMQKAGVPVSDNESDPMYGVPIAKNRKQKLAALECAGFVETN